MIFAVLDPKSQDITDPETGHVIGSIFRPKVYVKIVSVQENISMAETFRKQRVNIGGTAGTGLGITEYFAKSLLAPKYVDRYETFKTEEAAWEELPEDQSFVKTGDPVEQVNEERAAILADLGKDGEEGTGS